MLPSYHATLRVHELPSYPANLWGLVLPLYPTNLWVHLLPSYPAIVWVHVLPSYPANLWVHVLPSFPVIKFYLCLVSSGIFCHLNIFSIPRERGKYLTSPRKRGPFYYASEPQTFVRTNQRFEKLRLV